MIEKTNESVSHQNSKGLFSARKSLVLFFRGPVRIPKWTLVFIGFFLVDVFWGDVLRQAHAKSIVFFLLLYVCGLMMWVMSADGEHRVTWVLLTYLSDLSVFKYGLMPHYVLYSIVTIFISLMFVNNVATPAMLPRNESGDFSSSGITSLRGVGVAVSVKLVLWLLILVLAHGALLWPSVASHTSDAACRASSIIVVFCVCVAVVEILLCKGHPETPNRKGE